jgi:protein-S-isoprenylcysteine O-methyltransferase Ste14
VRNFHIQNSSSIVSSVNLIVQFVFDARIGDANHSTDILNRSGIFREVNSLDLAKFFRLLTRAILVPYSASSANNSAMSEFVTVLRSVLHNIGVVIVGFIIAFLGMKLDELLGLAGFKSLFSTIAACPCIAIGFFLRVWATYYFYQKQMRVISLSPQNALITSGPYRFSRNPLYLGGNVFIFLGAALFVGSPSALAFTLLHLPVMDLFIRREEKQLEETFGDDWLRYKKQVRRWL